MPELPPSPEEAAAKAFESSFQQIIQTAATDLPRAIGEIQALLSSFSSETKKSLGPALRDAETLVKVYTNYLDSVKTGETEIIKFKIDQITLEKQLSELVTKELITETEFNKIKQVQADLLAQKQQAAIKDTSDKQKEAADDAKKQFDSAWKNITDVVTREIDVVPAIGRAEALARGAGLGGIPVGPEIMGAVGLGKLGPEMFEGIGRTLLTSAERLNLFIEVVGSAPRVADTSSQKMTEMLETLVYFGNSIGESTKILIDSSRTLNFGAQDITKVYQEASGASRLLGMHTNETAQLMLDMARSLRAVGAGVKTSEEIAYSFTQNMNVLGTTLTQVEIKKFAQDLADGLSKLTPDKITGLLMFTQGGGGLPSIERIEAAAKNPLELAREVFGRIESQFSGDKTMQLLAAGPLFQLLGIGSGSFKETVEIKNILSQTGKSEEEISRELLKETKDPKEMMKEGLKSLEKMTDPLTQMTKSLRNIEQAIIGPLGHTIASLPNILMTISAGRALYGVGQAMGAFGGAATATRAAGTYAPMALRLSTPAAGAFLGGPAGWLFAAVAAYEILSEVHARAMAQE